MYQVTIQTTRQLTKRETPPREPTVHELRKDMYDLWRATVEPYTKDHRGKSTPEMTLMEVLTPRRSGATRRSPEETTPRRFGDAMGVARRVTSRGIANKRRAPSPGTRIVPTAIRRVTRRRAAGRRIPSWLPSGTSAGAIKRLLGLY